MRSFFAAAPLLAVPTGVQASSSHERLSTASARLKIDATIEKSSADVAVAFRTLDGRDELLVRPDVEYDAASTMKVPVLIELFRQARAGTLTLDGQIPVVNVAGKK